MKILYIANIRLPTEKAHGIQIMKTCEALASSGVQVKLLIPQRNNHIKENPFDFYNVKDNFIIEKVACLDFIHLPFFKKIFFWLESFTFYLSVKKFLKDKKYDVIYTRDLMLAYMLSKENKNTFYEAHTLPNNISPKYLKIYKRVAGILAISNGIKNKLIELGIEEEKICVVRDAVDTKSFNPNFSKEEARQKLHLHQHNNNMVLYTGHLYDWKGADILAKSAEYLSEAEIYLVGGTKEDIKSFKEKYQYKNLHIIGWRPHSEIPLWLSATDILVLPNSAKQKISSDYTSPMKLFEYMASGRPIIASDISSLREVLDENSTVFCHPDSIVSLVSKIKELLTDKKRQEEIAQEALQKVGRFTWKNRAKNILEFINKN